MTDKDKQTLQERTESQRMALVYDYQFHDFEEATRHFGADFIDALDRCDAVNDRVNRVAKLENVLGMLLALSTIYDSGSSHQSRMELQGQTEDTQYAVQITSAINDRAAGIKLAVEECLSLQSAYSAVLLGRKEFDVEFLNHEGESVNYETTEQLELLSEEK